ncbi:hypothetical protein EXN32_25455 [Agrobacterium tumefaciens]|uniref:hypothetical protein n=1 Tax=Agrobacterium TaxID=357 RepID=UPI00115CA70C|nr:MULTISPECIES: hypothetical protein [Agrobacterium]MDA5240547.1 hypothetical protein [Agrobacterium sp. MAFF310724]MDA5250230.1 hypothetical protein [Agrobacterium sp. MAFF210268]TRB10078.1 hypothetical protein EXN32_25455 [Agrobacterium tumefaciens]UXT19351.1 hypothetical protein FY140_00895 [Agrobacterium tumefaciens]
MDEIVEFRSRVLLATQAAFVGMIGHQIRAITCRWNAKQILVRVHYDGPIDDSELEIMSEVQSEILSHFPDVDASVECRRIDPPQRIEFSETEAIVFMRREPDKLN